MLRFLRPTCNKWVSETKYLFISLLSLSYVLTLMEYCTDLDRKYTSNFTHHSITNLKVLTILCDCCACGLSCDCGLNCETAIKRNATASILESMCYFNRKIGLPDFGTASFRVGINLDLTTTICYSMHTAVCNSSFSLETISSTAELFIKDHAKSRITRPVWWERRNVKILSTYVY